MAPTSVCRFPSMHSLGAPEKTGQPPWDTRLGEGTLVPFGKGTWGDLDAVGPSVLQIRALNRWGRARDSHSWETGNTHAGGTGET